MESLALAEDRIVILEKLTPGTEDYYYYHCIHFQHTNQFDKVEELLGEWKLQHRVLK
ncbi:MAG: hypothetical protein ACI86H_002612 [bacterium]|jgi:hypothetical protein